MASNLAKKCFLSIFNFFTDRLNFCLLYFSLTLLWSIPCLNVYVNPFMKLCFVWSIGLIVWDFFTKRNMLRGYKSVLLVLFMASYLISVLLNREVFYEGVKHFIYSAALLLLFYPFDDSVSIERQKKYAVYINDVFAALTFAVSTVSVVMFVLRISYVFRVGTTEFGQGVMYNRLYGLYISANPGALMSTCAVFLSIVTYFLDKEHFLKYKVFYAVNAVIQFIFYTLTLSNGGYIAWIAGLVTLAAFIAFPFFRKRMRAVAALALATAVFVASFAVFEGATRLSRSGMVWLANTVSGMLPEDEIPKDPAASSTNTPTADNSVVLERVEGEDKEVDNGRTTIWAAGIAALRQRPVFGWGDCRFYGDNGKVIPVDESKLTEQNISELKRAEGYMHNAVIQIAVCSGLAGLAFFVLFAAFLGIKYITALFKLYNTKYYYPFAAVFVFVTVMLSQMAAEAHILFTHQDAYACAFWFYLGLGVRYMRYAKKESAEDFVFVCDTPLHVMNAASFVLSNEQSCGGKSDLFIYHQFRGSEELSRRVRDSGIFRNVYDFDKLRIYSRSVNKIATFFRVMFPRRALKKICREKACLKCNYRTLSLSFYTPFSDIVKCCFEPTHVIQLEDGLGSYVTPDLENRFRSGIFSFFNKFFFGNKLSYAAETLYLSSPEFSGPQETEIRRLESFASATDRTELMKRVYGFNDNPIYREKKAVYITQPLEERHPTGMPESELLALLSEADPVIRVHPRQSASEFPGTVDTAANMWELECAENISDSHVLIGAFSTAQFTPKMMFDREPTLIFTYPLLGCEFDNADAMIERLRSTYRDRDKVRVIKTADELKEVIAAIK